MRAKQLEILKMGANAGMGIGVNAVIYNLAFSPKIRHIDISSSTGTNADTAEALYKLLKISGAIETLLMRDSDVLGKLPMQFF
jgi:GTP cyclohydrolase III